MIKNLLSNVLTRDEQKIFGYLAVLMITGMVLYYTGVSTIYAEKAGPGQTALIKATEKDSIILIDIRTAEVEELTLLPGIGEKRAADIIAYRQNKQFESTEELLNIKGIGSKTFLNMKQMLLQFGTTGAGVTNQSKLTELQTVESRSDNSAGTYDKQELDESAGITKKGYVAEKPYSDYSQGIIHLNTASKQDLMSLDGIGDIKADAILAYRRQIGKFTSVEQLTDVKGIGPKTLEKNRHRLSL